jgi:hypothetical protein
MNRKRFITELSANEKTALEQLVKTGITHRERQRAQAILWSNKGKDMQVLLEWLKIDRDTLSSWFTRWQTLGIGGLKDKPKSGRRKKISQEEEKKSFNKQRQQ